MRRLLLVLCLLLPAWGPPSFHLGSNPYASIVTLNAAVSPAASHFNALLHAVSPYVATSGAVGKNIPGFQNVSYQRNALYLAEYGMQITNTTYINQAWLAFNYGFAQQSGNGSFPCPQCGGVQQSQIEASGFFLAYFAETYLLFQASSYWAATNPTTGHTYQTDFVAMLPGLLGGINYLQSLEGTAPYNVPGGAMWSEAAANANRLFFYAIAEQLGGQILNTTINSGTGLPYCGSTLGDGNCTLSEGGVTANVITTGIFLANEGLGLQNVAGYFAESGGYDSSYNCTSMLSVETLLTYATNKGSYTTPLATALVSALLWENTRLLPNGAVSWSGNTRTAGQEVDPNGAAKTLNYFEMPTSLLYAGMMLSNTAEVAIGNNIAAYALNNGCMADTFQFVGPLTNVALTVPPGCHHFKMILVGEGGGGGSGSTTTSGGAGGVGAYAGSNFVLSSQTITIVSLGGGASATQSCVTYNSGADCTSATANRVVADFGTSASGATAGTGGQAANSFGQEVGSGPGGRAGVTSGGAPGAPAGYSFQGGNSNATNYGGGGGAGIAGAGGSPPGLAGGPGGIGVASAPGGTGGAGSAVGNGTTGNQGAAGSGAGSGGGGLTEASGFTAGNGGDGLPFVAIDGTADMSGSGPGGGGGAALGTGGNGGAGKACGAPGAGGGWGTVAGGTGGAGGAGCFYGYYYY